MELNNYLEELRSQIRNKKAKDMVVKEIKNHIEDQAKCYQEEGIPTREAMEKAVKQMGDPVEVGIEMDRIHRPKPAGHLLLMAVIISLAGLLTQYFSFYRFEEELMVYQRIIENAFERQSLYVLTGTVIMVVVVCLDYSLIGRYGKRLGFLFLAAITLICFYAPAYNGSHSYMKSFIYLFVPLYGGILYQNRNRGYYGVISCLLWLGAAFLVGETQIGGGVGITFDMACICYIMLLTVIIKGWFQQKQKAGLMALACILPGAAFLSFLINMAPYQIRRLEVMIQPEKYAETSGYQMAHAREVVRSLTLFGSGDGKLEHLPSRVLPGVQYDFIMLQAASVYGIIIVILLMALLSFFLFYLFRMIHKQKNQLGKITGYGCTLVLAVEMVRSLLNCFGFYTISTGGLPFFSYGRCHTLTIYMLLGIIFSIYRYQNLSWEQNSSTEPKEKGILAHFGKYRIRIERCR